MRNKFPWGKVVDKYKIVLRDIEYEVIEYFPNKYERCQKVYGEYEDYTMLNIPVTGRSYKSIETATIGVLSYRLLGNNSDSVAEAINRILKI